MGPIPFFNMKVLILACLVSLVSCEWTCQECNSLINYELEYATVEESFLGQAKVLSESLCPGEADPVACDAEMFEWWPQWAAVLWPYIFDAENICKDLCTKNSLRAVSCDECKAGLQALADGITAEENISAMVTYLQGDAFCQGHAICEEDVAKWIPEAIPSSFNTTLRTETWMKLATKALPRERVLETAKINIFIWSVRLPRRLPRLVYPKSEKGMVNVRRQTMFEIL